MRLFRRHRPDAAPEPAAPAAPGRPRLTFALGGTARHGSSAAAGRLDEVLLPGGRFVIGRGKDVHLRLHDPAVSPRHLAIETEGDRLVLRDLGSMNGTLVDGLPTLEAALANGNRIELGQTTLIFTRDEPDDDGGREGGEGS